MYSISATRISIIGTQDAKPDNSFCTGAAAYRTYTSTEEAFSERQHPEHYEAVISCALVDGIFPDPQDRPNDSLFLVRWLVQHKKAEPLFRWLAQAPVIIRVSTNEIASGLLAIMQSGLSFSGLTVQLSENLEGDVLKEVIAILGQAFQANASLTSIVIRWDGYDSCGLGPLFDVLAGVAGLEFITEQGRMGSSDLALVSNLLSKNKTLRVLELANLGIDMSNYSASSPPTGSVAGVIKQIAGQLRLERLELSNIPPRCQAVIGELMRTSDALKKLTLRLLGWKVDSALVDGFSQTSSVESVCLLDLHLGDRMLPLLACIAENNTSIKRLELQTSYRYQDQNDNPGICRLISGNCYLESLTWRFSGASYLDLEQIGIALGKNTRLESLMLLDTSRSNGDWQPGWLNEKTISGLAEKLKKNHTLTELVLAPESHLSSPISRNYSVLQQVLDRNSALQRYACSDAFLCGAVEGFFATKSMPTDTVIATAKALMQYKPRTGAAALALVNKASYAQALFRRRQAHPDMLDKLLPITRNLLIDNRKTMIGLLNGIIVNRDDFSNDDFCRIADSRTLPAALVAIMLQSPPDYLYLIKLFCQAVGVAKIRSEVIGQLGRKRKDKYLKLEGTTDDYVLSMLEQSFPPEQGHLAPFVKKELDYHSLRATPAKLFVGYQFVHIHSASLVSWCVENQQPGVLIAFQVLYKGQVTINFDLYGKPFTQSMVEQLPLLKDQFGLSIIGTPDHKDALVLQGALAGSSNLEFLRIDENYCGPELGCIMEGLNANASIREISFDCMPMAVAIERRGALARLLEANRAIREITVEIYADDPELPDLVELAATDRRLELTIVEQGETSSDQDSDSDSDQDSDSDSDSD